MPPEAAHITTVVIHIALLDFHSAGDWHCFPFGTLHLDKDGEQVASEDVIQLSCTQEQEITPDPLQHPREITWGFQLAWGIHLANPHMLPKRVPQ